MNFLVDLCTGDDGPGSGVAEVVFPDARLQLNEYRSGNDKTSESMKLSTLTHYDDLVLPADGATTADPANGDLPAVTVRDDRRTTVERYTREGWLLFAHAWRPEVSAGVTSLTVLAEQFARLSKQKRSRHGLPFTRQRARFGCRDAPSARRRRAPRRELFPADDAGLRAATLRA